MKVIGYGRASTRGQELTFELQQTKIEQYCALYGLELAGFVFDYESGSVKTREGLIYALTQLELGLADG